MRKLAMHDLATLMNMSLVNLFVRASFYSFLPKTNCKACALGKLTKFHISPTTFVSNSPLELVFSDP